MQFGEGGPIARGPLEMEGAPMRGLPPTDHLTEVAEGIRGVLKRILEADQPLSLSGFQISELVQQVVSDRDALIHEKIKEINLLKGNVRQQKNQLDSQRHTWKSLGDARKNVRAAVQILEKGDTLIGEYKNDAQKLKTARGSMEDAYTLLMAGWAALEEDRDMSASTRDDDERPTED